MRDVRKGLLACGVLSSALYVVANDVVAARRWPGYRRTTQAISELSSVGAPSRSVLVPWLALAYSPLVVGFGLGVRQSADGNRALRAAGTALVAYGATGPLWLPFPMTRREELAATDTMPLADRMHLVLSGVTAVLHLAAMGFGGAALGRRFRVYSLVSAATFLVFGGLTGVEARKVGTGDPTPWLGVVERVMMGATLQWMAVLAAALWRRPAGRQGRSAT